MPFCAPAAIRGSHQHPLPLFTEGQDRNSSIEIRLVQAEAMWPVSSVCVHQPNMPGTVMGTSPPTVNPLTSCELGTIPLQGVVRVRSICAGKCQRRFWEEVVLWLMLERERKIDKKLHELDDIFNLAQYGECERGCGRSVRGASDLELHRTRRQHALESWQFLDRRAYLLGRHCHDPASARPHPHGSSLPRR